ncbi:MAG: hypothetical protein ABIG96_03990 [Candidatus Micrarchaeota archaeon]
MDLSYVAQAVLTPEFLYPYAFLTLMIWFFMRVLFNYDDLGQAMVLALVAMLFLPAILASMQVGSAFLLLILVGSMVLSYTYQWDLGATILIFLISLYAASVIMPVF